MRLGNVACWTVLISGRISHSERVTALRTSKAEGGDETSIPVQLADCRRRAEGQTWEIAAEYVDGGISGWKRKTRPGYERLFENASEGRIDAVASSSP